MDFLGTLDIVLDKFSKFLIVVLNWSASMESLFLLLESCCVLKCKVSESPQ